MFITHGEVLTVFSHASLRPEHLRTDVVRCAHRSLTPHHTVRPHLHAGPKVRQLEMTAGVQQHVVGLDVPVDEAHAVDGVQGQDHLCGVEHGPLEGHLVVAHQVDKVAARHVVHHHVEIPEDCHDQCHHDHHHPYLWS